MEILFYILGILTAIGYILALIFRKRAEKQRDLVKRWQRLYWDEREYTDTDGRSID